MRVVTGAGTGTWEFTAGFDGVTEIQPGSFVLMDCVYHAVRPEFGCALSILAAVISKRPGWYVLDAGSKAISKDFGSPIIKDHPEDKVARLSEEHAKVETNDATVRIGDRRFEPRQRQRSTPPSLRLRPLAQKIGRIICSNWPAFFKPALTASQHHKPRN